MHSKLQQTRIGRGDERENGIGAESSLLIKFNCIDKFVQLMKYRRIHMVNLLRGKMNFTIRILPPQ